MVDVEQRPLRALEQDALAGAAVLVEQPPHRVLERQHFRGDAGEFIIDRLGRDLGEAEAAPQGVVVGEQPLDFFRQRVEVGEVIEADGAPPDLVLVGRADAALGGADLGAGAAALAQGIEFPVERQDQRGVVGDAQGLARDRDALLAEALDLGRRGHGDRAPRRCRSPPRLPGRTTPEGRSDSL